jgi:hypothetical protein
MLTAALVARAMLLVAQWATLLVSQRATLLVLPALVLLSQGASGCNRR